MFKIEEVAKICHEANCSYCEVNKDYSQMPWQEAPEWQRTSAINGVKFHLEHPDAKPCDSHNSWLKEKELNGWKFGPVKDAIKKEHPCFVPYEKLPINQQLKDSLFIAVVNVFRNYVEKE